MVRKRLLVSFVLWAVVPQLLNGANPVLPGADPHAIAVGNTVWLYPTWSDSRMPRRPEALARPSVLATGAAALVLTAVTAFARIRPRP